MFGLLTNFITKVLGSALVAGFKEWLANRTAQQLGAAEQRSKDQEAEQQGAKDVRKIKNTITTNDSIRQRVRNRFKAKPNSSQD